MNNITEMVVTIATAIVGVAILAVIVSKKSNTAAVLQNLGSMFTNALGVAVSPVSGSPVRVNTAYAGSSGFGFPNTLDLSGLGVGPGF